MNPIIRLTLTCLTASMCLPRVFSRRNCRIMIGERNYLNYSGYGLFVSPLPWTNWLCFRIAPRSGNELKFAFAALQYNGRYKFLTTSRNGGNDLAFTPPNIIRGRNALSLMKYVKSSAHQFLLQYDPKSRFSVLKTSTSKSKSCMVTIQGWIPTLRCNTHVPIFRLNAVRIFRI